MPVRALVGSYHLLTLGAVRREGLVTTEVNHSELPTILVVSVSRFGRDLGSLDTQAVADFVTALETTGHAVEAHDDLVAGTLLTELRRARRGDFDVVHLVSDGEWKTESQSMWLAGVQADADSVEGEHWVDLQSWLSETAHTYDPLLLFLEGVFPTPYVACCRPCLFPGGVGKTWRDTTLGAERPHLAEWKELGW